LTKW